jgi:hypothetical protein
MNLVDDARSLSLPLMAPAETKQAAMQALWAWVNKYGIPQALYTDRKNIFITDREPTDEEVFLGQEPLTDFGRACKKLGIRIITAHSPQAKGRVERNHGIYQDRLVKQMAVRDITSIEEANTYLAGGFVEDLNAKFARQAPDPLDAHCPVPKGLDLAHVFCWEETRTVANDWTVRYKNQFLQIEASNRSLPKPKEKIVIQTLLDGSIYLMFHEKSLHFKRVPASPAPLPIKKPVPAPRKKPKPAPDHPWRRSAARKLPMCAQKSSP